MNKLDAKPKLLAGVAFAFLVVVMTSMKIAAYVSFEAGVMPDEYRYMIASFFPESADTDYGNYLYTAIYGVAAQCGEAWYQCVKGINLFFDIGAGVLLGLAIYLSTRNWGLSALGFGLTLAGPFHLFGGYFLPESMHTFLFLAAFLVMTVTVGRQNSWWAVLPGFVLSLAMLTKPHTISVAALSIVVGAVLLSLPHLRGNRRFGLYAIILGTSAIVFRVAGGFIFAGYAGLNPFASYFSFSGLVDTLLPADTESQAASVELANNDRFIEAIISGVTNLMPAVLVLAMFSAVLVKVSPSKAEKILSTDSNVMGLVFFLGPVLLSAAFGALLELRDAEETIFRTMTRYWEFALPILIFVVLSSISGRSRDETQPKVLERLALRNVLILIPASLSAIYLWFIPRKQTMSDTSLVEDNYHLFSVAVLAAVVLVLMTPSKYRSGFSLAPVALILTLSFVSVSQMLSFTTDEKSGAAGGRYVLEKIKIYPGDSDRVAFVGDRVAGFVGAFTAKLPNAEIQTSDPYSVTNVKDIPNSPRWVVASPEVYIQGEYVSRTVVGDSVVYEFMEPSPIAGYELYKYGILSTSELQETFWGAWVDGQQTTITVPQNISGSVLQLNLIANSDLEDSRIEVSFDGQTAVGQLLENQEVTPVSLRRPDGSDWSGASVTIKYLGNFNEAKDSIKGYAFGIDSISVFNVK